MEYRRLGRTGLKVSELCLGTMTFGWTADEAASFDIMSAALDGGVNFFDTADIYTRADHSGVGTAEQIIGRWLKDRPRDQLVIASKVRGSMGDGPNDQGLSRGHILDAVEGSLHRLDTDYIDLYQCHWPDDETPLDETLRALGDLVHQGKVRYIGCSNYPAWKLTKALWTSDKHGLARFDCLQPHYNLVRRAEFERELMPLCADQGIGVIPYSPLAGGFLTGKYRKNQPIPEGTRGQSSRRIQSYMTDANFALMDRMEAIGRERGLSIAQVALAWLLSNPVITSPIIGANSVAQLQESLGVVGQRLSAEEKQALDEASAWK
jgi:aryl-alcohol dehydrogenase-like predicted oxidoreductase